MLSCPLIEATRSYLLIDPQNRLPAINIFPDFAQKGSSISTVGDKAHKGAIKNALRPPLAMNSPDHTKGNGMGLSAEQAL